MSIELILPETVDKRLKEKAKEFELSEEELILEAVAKSLELELDPESKAEAYTKLSEKYLEHAKKFMADKDFAQASEKLWGSSALALKAVAAKKGKELKSHGELWKYAIRLSEELEDDDLRRFWHVAVTLHQNFYENWMPEEAVKRAEADIRGFIEKLQNLTLA
ncbi:hypothetical protein CW713_09700 [Methanophagales archaeon]|nr:MAG: hypothetical protein CW713_09700 [Methanophagales archaeon]